MSPICLGPISKTAGDTDSVKMEHLQEMGPGISNGHVPDLVTYVTLKVQGHIPDILICKCLESC